MKTMNDIARMVAESARLSLAQLDSRSTAKGIVHPRQEAMYVMHQTGRWSHPQIGRFFDNRDHTTSVNASRVVAERMRACPKTNSRVLAYQRGAADAEFIRHSHVDFRSYRSGAREIA